MSHPELRLVWTNEEALTSRSERRRQRAQRTHQPMPDDNPQQRSGVGSYFDRKQFATIIIAALLGAVLSQTGKFVNWIWSNASENQENSLIEKLRKDDTLASNIKTKVIDSAEFRGVRTDVEDTKKQVNDIKVSLGRIEGRLNIAKAQALGIPNPNIQRVSLVPQEKFNAIIITLKNQKFFFQYTIVRVQGDRVVIRFDGRDSNNNMFEGNIFIIEAVPGRVYDLSQIFSFSNIPRILFAILDRPTPQTLDIAIGAAEATRS